MGKIRKINDLYYIDFVARGLLYSQVAGNNLGDAQKLLLQVEEKIAGGEALTITRHIELPDFFDRFLSHINSQNYSPKSSERFAETITHFTLFLKKDHPQIHELTQLTPVVIESYKVYLAKTQKAKIVNLTLLLLRDVLEFGIKLRFINDNPSLHIRLLPWARLLERRTTVRYELARQLLSQGVGLGKLTQLLKLPDISRTVYFANLIPLSREDVYN